MSAARHTGYLLARTVCQTAEISAFTSSALTFTLAFRRLSWLFGQTNAGEYRRTVYPVCTENETVQNVK